MCDFITPTAMAAIAAGVSAAGSLGAAAMSASQQQKAADAQATENLRYMRQQSEFRRQEQERQDALRDKADAERQAGLETQTAENQKKTQQTEEERLFTDMAKDVPEQYTTETVGDKLLSGMGGTTNKNVTEDLATRLTQASRNARDIIRSQAAVQSFGPSQFGLMNSNARTLNDTSQNIGLFNNMRNGSLQAFGVEKSMQPTTLPQSPNYWGPISSTLASVAGSMAGSSFGGSGANASGNNFATSSSPYAYGSGGYTGAGPFKP